MVIIYSGRIPLVTTISFCRAQHYTRKLDVYSRKNHIGSQIDRASATHQHQRWYRIPASATKPPPTAASASTSLTRDQSIRYTSTIQHPPSDKPASTFELFDRSVVLCYCVFYKIWLDHMLIILIITTWRVIYCQFPLSNMQHRNHSGLLLPTVHLCFLHQHPLTQRELINEICFESKY